MFFSSGRRWGGSPCAHVCEHKGSVSPLTLARNTTLTLHLSPFFFRRTCIPCVVSRRPTTLSKECGRLFMYCRHTPTFLLAAPADKPIDYIVHSVFPVHICTYIPAWPSSRRRRRGPPRSWPATPPPAATGKTARRPFSERVQDGACDNKDNNGKTEKRRRRVASSEESNQIQSRKQTSL